MRRALARSLAKAAKGIQQAGEELQTDTGFLGGREAAAGIPLRHTVAADQVPGPRPLTRHCLTGERSDKLGCAAHAKERRRISCCTRKQMGTL